MIRRALQTRKNTCGPDRGGAGVGWRAGSKKKCARTAFPLTPCWPALPTWSPVVDPFHRSTCWVGFCEKGEGANGRPQKKESRNTNAFALDKLDRGQSMQIINYSTRRKFLSDVSVKYLETRPLHE